jgi:HPt (histidine-containing phosphotransfer) domain-containing protein
MSQTKSIDAEVIENLKSLGGMELLMELHTVYMATSTALIKDIHTAVSSNNAQLLQEKAHSLKSSSKNLDQAAAITQQLDKEFKQVSVELAEIVKIG